jgi:hypothetical protein
MRIKMNTDILPLLNVGTYGYFDAVEDNAEEMYVYNEEESGHKVTEEELENFRSEWCKEFKQVCVDKGKIIIEELTGFKVFDVEFYSPHYYNYSNDCLDFELEIPDSTKETLIGLLKDEEYWKWVERIPEYHSRSGFISSFPGTKERWLEEAEELDPTIVASWIRYEISKNEDVNLDEIQSDFEDYIIENV